jgi:ABC-type bacteriocin/lantibiotic exporter with double-glycine peptidase domain
MNMRNDGSISYALKNVTLYGDKGKILDAVTFSLPDEGLYLVAGRSGAGKTSLLRLMNGLVSPDSGSVQFDGRELSTFYMPEFRSRNVLVAQESAVVPGSVLDNIRLPESFAINRDRSIPESSILTLCEKFGLGYDVLTKEASRLSGGEKQRIAVIRALLMDARVLILDEPTSALDLRSEEAVAEVLADMKSGALLVVVSHSNAFLRLADGVLMMASGRVIEQRESVDENAFREFLDMDSKSSDNG